MLGIRFVDLWCGMDRLEMEVKRKYIYQRLGYCSSRECTVGWGVGWETKQNKNKTSRIAPGIFNGLTKLFFFVYAKRVLLDNVRGELIIYRARMIKKKKEIKKSKVYSSTILRVYTT